MPNLDQLQQALANIEGCTPKEVLDAFLPKGNRIGEHKLVPITFGHALFLSQMGHPLAKGNLDGWEPHDVAVALFAFTRNSRELKRGIENETITESIYEISEQIPFGEITKYVGCLLAHYIASMETGMEMKPPETGKAQKKTRLVGFWRRLLAFVASISGRLNLLFTSSR